MVVALGWWWIIEQRRLARELALLAREYNTTAAGIHTQ